MSTKTKALKDSAALLNEAVAKLEDSIAKFRAAEKAVTK